VTTTNATVPPPTPLAVRWDARSPHEYIDNYKIIQQVFEKKGIDKYIGACVCRHVATVPTTPSPRPFPPHSPPRPLPSRHPRTEVEKLMRGKYQDNLENMQWFKSFFEKNYSGQPYEPIARRAKGKGADSTSAFALTAAKRGPSHSEPAEENTAPAPRATKAPGTAPASAPAAAAAAAPASKSSSSSSAGPSTASSAGAAASTRAAGSKPATAGLGASGRHGSSPAGAGSSSAAMEALRGKVADLTQANGELTVSVESLEKERDFYFGKLRDIEILLQTYSGPDKCVAVERLRKKQRLATSPLCSHHLPSFLTPPPSSVCRATIDAVFKILYATEEDFVAVEGGEGAGDAAGAPA
jgi:hypothetical protein